MIDFKRILCPIDFSDTSIRALTCAATLAAWYDAQLEVLHVVPDFEDRMAPDWSPRTAASAAPMAREIITPEIRRVLEAAGPPSVKAEAVVQKGCPDEVIASRAQAQSADLVVMGTHGRSGFNRLLLGSVTEKVLRTTTCPVLTVPPTAFQAKSAAVTFKRILCAMDYSPSALKALRYGLELGRQTDGCVTVLYALEYMRKRLLRRRRKVGR